MRAEDIAAGARRVFRNAALVSRIVAALPGGYALGALASAAALALPIDLSQSLLAGMMLGLLVHAGAVIWVFAVRSATRAWLGLAVAALPLLAALLWFMQAGGAS